MPEVAVVTDSVAGLTRELITQYGITIVPIRLLVRDRVYRDSVDMTPAEAYRFLEQDPDDFKTSPSSPTHFLEAFREASLKDRSVICITISSGLSTSYNVAGLAKEQAAAEMPGVAIEVIDSMSVTAAEGFIALAAARAAESGANLRESVKAAEYVRDKVTFLAILETMQYVYRTGRVPKVAAQVGSLLSIKPILTISSGLVHLKSVARSKEHGVSRMLLEMKEKVDDRRVHVAVMHADVPDEAESLRRKVETDFNCAELWITEFSPVMGYATGKGTLGLAFYAED